MEKDRKRLLASTTLSRSEKSILFDLLLKSSQEYKDSIDSEKKFITYFSELYNKHLIPKELAKDIKNSTKGFVRYISGICLSGSTIFDMETTYSPDDAEDNFSIPTTQSFKLDPFLVDVRYLIVKDDKSIVKVDVGTLLMKKLSKGEKNLLKSLYCDYIENNWREKNYLREYKGYECFSTVSTWDALYKLNPDWYDLLYSNLTYHSLGSGSEYDLLSKTKFDKEINEAESIDILIRKLINYINE